MVKIQNKSLRALARDMHDAGTAMANACNEDKGVQITLTYNRHGDPSLSGVQRFVSEVVAVSRQYNYTFKDAGSIERRYRDYGFDTLTNTKNTYSSPEDVALSAIKFFYECYFDIKKNSSRHNKKMRAKKENVAV